MLETAIIGGGLCGLALANLLRGAGRDYAVFEGRERLGGRIHATPQGHDLGPTWYWPEFQPRITRLVDDLGLAWMDQWETGQHLLQAEPDGRPSPFVQPELHGRARRLVGGMPRLIEALAGRLPAPRLHLGWHLHGLQDQGDHVLLDFLTTDGPRQLRARHVVLAIPPRVAEHTLSFGPALPPELLAALRDSPTWMAAQAKAIAPYATPFWRERGLTGTAIAPHPRAALGESWDACEPGAPALAAFVALDAVQRESFAGGLPLLLDSHLVQLFGEQAGGAPLEIQDWAREPLTCAPLDREPPRGHPDYPHTEPRQPHWQGRLHFGASETAAYCGGYMEGALESAGRIRRELGLGWRQAA